MEEAEFDGRNTPSVRVTLLLLLGLGLVLVLLLGDSGRRASLWPHKATSLALTSGEPYASSCTMPRSSEVNGGLVVTPSFDAAEEDSS